MSRPSGSMRIAICAVQVPFERGGAEVLVEGLRRQLVARGHSVDVVSLPVKWYPGERLLSSCLQWRMLDLSEANGRPIDLVIATKFPSYVIKHANKVTWLVHQHRQAYDWYGTALSDFSPTPESARLRQSIIQVDQRSLSESRRLFAISRNVADRLQRFNGLHAGVLYPPTLHEGMLRCDGYGDTVVCVSRLDAAKRIDLLVRAMRSVPTAVRCVIAGTGPDRERLEKLSVSLGLADRVRFAGWVDDETLLRLFAECFAVFYAPLDEDYGYATVEAFQAAKPVVTASDSGGVLEFVEHDVTGCVAAPEPAALAAQIARLHADKALCARLGQAGKERVAPIRWDAAIAQLLA